MEENKLFPFLIAEYEKLKDEQHKRIEFRDHMIYLNLGAVGAVFSFAIEKPNFDTALLVLPFVCFVLGWTYLVNDQKITLIGKYIVNVVIPRVGEIHGEAGFMNWETYRKKDRARRTKKVFQLMVDLCIFVLTAMVSIASFYVMHGSFSTFHIIVTVAEMLALLLLTYFFIRYAEVS